MNFNHPPRKFAAYLTAVLVLTLSLAVLTDAQKTRKKKTRRPVAAAPVTTAVPVDSNAIIYGQAGDLLNQEANLPQPSTDGQTLLPLDETARDKQLADMSARIKTLESGLKNGYDERQKRLLLNLDILTRAEQRAEALRKQRFELVEKENQIQTRLDQIEIDIRPDTIERSVAVAGTLRPEELRESRRKSLDNERKNLESLLVQVQTTRAGLDESVLHSDQLVQKLRAKLEVDIDKSLDEDKDQ